MNSLASLVNIVPAQLPVREGANLSWRKDD
jgi:hypothetical protein